MENIQKRKPYKRIALALSLCMLIVWAILGTGASLAWFTDTSPEITNIFHFAEFDLKVYHRLTDGTYEEIDDQTKIFDDEALYEPGYVQVVYLKIENAGTVPFDFKTAVSVKGYTPATNAYGWSFNLQDHLRFGLVTADTEAEMLSKVKTREMANQIATMKLNNYSTEVAELDAQAVKYMALVVAMPEEVGNEANYRGDAPTVELGIIVQADQQKE